MKQQKSLKQEILETIEEDGLITLESIAELLNKDLKVISKACYEMADGNYK